MPADNSKLAHMLSIAMRGLDQLFNGKLQGNNRKVGLVLLVFPLNTKQPQVSYISNSDDPKSPHRALKNLLDNWTGPIDPPFMSEPPK